MELSGQALSLGSEPSAQLGYTQPRLWTPPLVDELTPDTSYGFDVIEFAGELLPDGRPRFRIVLVLVARQNGKTHVLVVLSLFWLYVECVEMVLGTSTKLEYAGESWRKACRLALSTPELRAEIPRKRGIRKTNGEQTLWRADPLEQIADLGSRYKIAAANEDAGRSLTISRLILDELRQHHDRSAWDAAVPATSAVWDAQTYALSNAGSEKSVVLIEEREAAKHYIETGEGDPRVGLFEYSAPPGSSPTDLEALRQANPNLARRKDAPTLLAEGAAAQRAGGKKLAGYLTEHMCLYVPQMDPAINLVKWETPAPLGCYELGDLSAVRDRVAAVLDLSLDGEHATLYAAAVLPDGRVRVDPVKAWAGPECTKDLRAELPGELRRVKPRVFGWFPDGPAAAIMADIKNLPKTVTVEAIKAETPAVCMGFAELVNVAQVAQAGDPLLNAQVKLTERLWFGDRWKYVRHGAGHCDATYAAAGAAHLARTLPPPVKAGLLLPTGVVETEQTKKGETGD
jgi:hypothetical protein